MKRLLDVRVIFPAVAVLAALVGWLFLRWTWVSAFGAEPDLSKSTLPVVVDVIGVIAGLIGGVSAVGSIYVHARWSRLRVAIPLIAISLLAFFNAALFLYAVAIFNGVA